MWWHQTLLLGCSVTCPAFALQENMGDVTFVRAYRCVRESLEQHCDPSLLGERVAAVVKANGFAASAAFPTEFVFADKFLPHIQQLISAEDMM